MADLDNPFAPPKADLVDAWTAPDDSEERSIEDAIAGNWEVSVGKIIERAWELTSGAKLTFFLAGLILVIPGALSTGVSMAITGLDPGFFENILVTNGVALLFVPITAPLYAGLWHMQIRRASGREIRVSHLFVHFDKIIPIAIAQALLTVAMLVGYAMLVLPGLFVAIAGSMTLPLVAERGLSPVEALTTSIKAVSSHFFDVLVVYLLAGVLIVAGFLAVGIGIIWAAPAAAICTGLVYVTIFGWKEPSAP